MRLRFFFDAGAGVCLWAQDEEAKVRFGYAVGLDNLDLPDGVSSALTGLMSDYDARIDWDDPGRTGELDTGPITFGYEAGAPLRDRVREVLVRLREALGPGFEIESDYEG